jgi:hypothetical protein
MLAAVAWIVLCVWGLENGHDWLCFGTLGIFIVTCLVFLVVDFDGEED